MTHVLKTSALHKAIVLALFAPLAIINTAHAATEDTAVDTIAVDDSDTPTTTLDTITVTANSLYYIDPSEDNDHYSANVATVGTKIPDYIENIPQSITVVTQQKMDDLNVETLDEVAQRTTGLRILQNDDGRSSVYSRGYEYDQYSIDGLSSPMASINGTLPNLIAFDRVEVMRGPSGLFNSSSEMGGVVNLVRKRGHVDGKNTLQASAYDPKGYELSGDVQGSLSDDGRTVGRFIAQHKSQVKDNVDDAGGDPNENSTVYAAIDHHINEDSTVGAGYLYQRRDLTPDNGLPLGSDGELLSLPNDDFYGSKWNDFDSESHDFFIDGRTQLANKGTVSAGLRYSDRTSDYNYTFARTALKDDNTVNALGLAGEVDETSLTADINLSQPFEGLGGQSEYVIGMDYKNFQTDAESARTIVATDVTAEQINDLAYTDIMAAVNGGAGYSHTDTELEELGIYTKVKYQLTEPLTVIAGGRMSNWDIKEDVAGDSRDGKGEFTGYGGLVYELTPYLNAYASYTEVFKPQTDTDTDGQILKPREGEQWEAGLKGHWGDAMSARLSAFSMTDENAAVPTIYDTTEALGERTVEGVEVEFNGDITDNWQLSAGYSYLDTEVDYADDSQGNVFILMPEHTANLWSTYKFNNPLPAPLTVGLGLNYVGEFESSQGIKADTYTTVDAMVRYPFSQNLKGQLNIYNLLDEDYYVRVGSVGTFNMPGEGREFKASLTYEF